MVNFIADLIMGTYRYFYPANDMALAFGKSNFTPSAAAVRLQYAGASLPVWMSEDDDIVVCRNPDMEFQERICEEFNIGVRLADRFSRKLKINPWGWSKAIKSEMTGLGAEPETMPDDKTIERFRLISHRRSSILINKRLASEGIATPPLPQEISGTEELMKLCRRYGRIMVKSPWSSSGRGVFDSGSISERRLQNIVNGILAHQGSAICEPYLEKERDFAMLFHADGAGGIRFEGLSVFSNVRGSAYQGNTIASQSHLREMLGIDGLNDIRDALISILPDITGEYEGNLGIDMMTYRSGGSLKTAPCVELNLRTTMGFIALHLADKYLAPGLTGKFSIIPVKAEGPADEAGPYVIKDHRLVSGVIDLVPPNPHFRFQLSAASDMVENIVQPTVKS